MLPQLGVLFVLMGIVAMVGIRRWGVFVSGRYGAPKWTRYVGSSCFALMALGPLGTIVGLFRACDAASDKDAPDRQRIIANGIAEAMYSTSIGTGLGLACVILLLVLTWRYHWSAKLPTPVGSPPYR